MTTPERPPPPEAPTTAWHPMLVALLETYLPSGYKLTPEFQLTHLPQRIDILIIQRLDEAPGPIRKLHTILDYLRRHTLIEHKGPTDDLEAGDFLTLVGYAYQYMRLAKVAAPGDLCLMVVADRITPAFVEQVKECNGSLVQVEEGLWRGELSGFALHGVETRSVPHQSPTERLLYAFSRAYLKNPLGILPLDKEERDVYILLYQQVEQFKRERGAMATKDHEALDSSYEEIMRELLKLPADNIVRNAAIEVTLRGLTLEQRLKGLKPEDLKPEDLDGLPPEVREQLKRLLH
jgi:hypothetical protein